MTDWSDGIDIGVKLPVFNSDAGQQKVTQTNTRAPTGGWPGTWSQLTPGETNEIGQDDYEITGIFANDSYWNLYLKIESDILNPTVGAGAAFDFYFNVSDTKWYKIQLFRNASDLWDLSLNYTTVVSAGTPDDSDTWTVEENYSGIATDSYDGFTIGFDYSTTTADSILFWVNKTNLSQGYASLAKPNNCTMFADSHDTTPLLANQVDRECYDPGV